MRETFHQINFISQDPLVEVTRFADPAGNRRSDGDGVCAERLHFFPKDEIRYILR